MNDLLKQQPTGRRLSGETNGLVTVLTSGNRKRILTAFKHHEPQEIQVAVLKHITDNGGALDLPLLLLSMDERAARTYHRFCWTCIALADSTPRFISAVQAAPRAAIYQLLAALADSSNLPRLYQASIEIKPGPADFFMAMCHASDEGITHLQNIGGPSELPAARGPYLDSPLGRATRAEDRVAMRNMFLQMVRHEVDPGRWLAEQRKELPAWAYRSMKSVWTNMIHSQVLEREGLDPSKVTNDVDVDD